MGITVSQTAPKNGHVEYAIYTFTAPDQSGTQPLLWQKFKTLKQRRKALQTAEKLARSGRYKKVEIKQKYFDRRAGRMAALTVRIFEDRKPLTPGKILTRVLTLLAGLSAFIVTYALTIGG